MPKTKRHRIADVARHAGVSEATVSVVLNNRVGDGIRVSEETQRRVWEAVETLGYVPNPAARNLARGRNNLIAVYTFESIFPIDSRNFYFPFLMGIEEEAASQGYDLLLSTAARDPAMRGRIYQQGSNRLTLADGAVLLGHAPDQREILQLLADEFPFVFVGRRESPNDDICYAASDYVTATYEIVQHLFAHQHEQIAYLSSPSRTEANRDRYAGFAAAFHETGRAVSPDLVWQGETESFSAETMKRFMQRGVTALICENDEIALRAMGVAGALHLRCPDDYSLAVLGDPLSMNDSGFHWTTFRIPRRAMGREAVRILISHLTMNEPTGLPIRSVLPCQFVPGSTVSVAKKR